MSIGTFCLAKFCGYAIDLSKLIAVSPITESPWKTGFQVHLSGLSYPIEVFIDRTDIARNTELTQARDALITAWEGFLAEVKS